MHIQPLLDNIFIILKNPKFPGNIGAAARCAMNMGISNIIVVSDEKPDRDKMLMMATHNATRIIDSITYFPDLRQALGDFAFIAGTTARQGRQRRTLATPRSLPPKLLPLLKNNRVALLFGPEDRGLTNEDLALCNIITSIPTADFSSLNLAQAVAIHCYEIYYALQQAEVESGSYAPQIANSFELEGLYQHIETVLARIGFLQSGDQEYWMRNIRRFLGRLGLKSREVKLIRGVCRQFLWFEEKK